MFVLLGTNFFFVCKCSNFFCDLLLAACCSKTIRDGIFFVHVLLLSMKNVCRSLKGYFFHIEFSHCSGLLFASTSSTTYTCFHNIFFSIFFFNFLIFLVLFCHIITHSHKFFMPSLTISIK